MKVVVVTKSFSKGGSASGATGVVRALDAAGIEVIRCDAYADPKSLGVSLARFAERVFERVCFDAETHCVRLARPTFDLAMIYEQYRPDIVQLCDVSGNVIGFGDLDNVPCPVVHRMSDFWPYHGPGHYAVSPQDSSVLARWLFNRTVYRDAEFPDVVVAPSHWLAKMLDKSGMQIHVIRNVTPLPSSPTPAIAPGKAVRFGFISNKVLDSRKGFTRVNRCLESLAGRGYKVSLHAFGWIRGSQRPKIDGVDISWHGSFGRDELKRVYESFDILLCPSQLDNSPNVLCEAIAHGRPVIAQSGTGMDSYVTDSFGRLVDFAGSAESIEHFVSACEDVLENYISFSEQATRFAAEALSPVQIGVLYRELYESLLYRHLKASR